MAKSTLTGSGASVPNSQPSFASLAQSIAHHDAAIEGLGTRMAGVEGTIRTLQGEVNSGFHGVNATLAQLTSKMNRFDARPSFDFHKTVSTVTTLAVLFSMVVGGIIYVTSAQTAKNFAEQKLLGDRREERIDKLEDTLENIAPRLSWGGTVVKEPRK